MWICCNFFSQSELNFVGGVVLHQNKPLRAIAKRIPQCHNKSADYFKSLTLNKEPSFSSSEGFRA